MEGFSVTKGIRASSHLTFGGLNLGFYTTAMCLSCSDRQQRSNELTESEEQSGHFNRESGVYFIPRLVTLQEPLAKLSLTVTKTEKLNSNSDLML